MDAVENVLREFKSRNSTVMVMPTATGKTVVFSHLIKRFMETGRVMVLAHRQELIQQAADKIEKITGLAPEIEMGQDWANEAGGFFGKPAVVVSSVQTQIASSRGSPRMERFDPQEFSLLVIDEFHHAVASTYRRIIDYYRRNEALKVLGCTATPDRTDKEALMQVCESVAFAYPILQAIEDGWIVPIRQRMIYVKDLDFSSMRTTAGDLNGADLAEVMEEEKTLHGVADPVFREAGGRPTLIFAASVKQGDRLAEILNRHEPDSARFVHAKTPDFVRREIFEHFAEGRFTFLVNVGICTEGWDQPRVALVVIARPTKSRSLYAQMVGRGFRTLAGIVDDLENAVQRKTAIECSTKPYLEVMDFCGNSGRHKLIYSTDILGGNVSPDVAVRAAKIVEAAKAAVPTVDAIAQARQQLEIERAKAEEAARRKSIKAKAQYSSRAIDPFAILEMTPATAMPRYNSQKTLSEKQKAVLERQGINHEDMPIAQSVQILNEIFRRWNAKLCSIKQARLLKRYNYSPDTTMAEAKVILDRLAANRWRE